MAKRESKSKSVEALVLEVMRESYLEATEDLRRYAEKVSFYNAQKKAFRQYLAALRKLRTDVMSAARERGVDVCRGDKKDMAVLARLFGQYAHPYDLREAEHRLCIPARVPLAGVDSVALLDDEIARWEERLASVGDDAQLANLDLQNMLQKQQQTLQMMSNISKMLHDNVMSIIRKIGG